MEGKDRDHIDEDRTFFCSELVAKCFKVCGIMEDVEDASSNFFPGHFASDQWTIPLKDGVQAIEERTIIKHEKPEAT